jgi:hypothetical protein
MQLIVEYEIVYQEPKKREIVTIYGEQGNMTVDLTKMV